MRYIILPIIKTLFFLKSMFVLLSLTFIWIFSLTILTLWYFNPKKAYGILSEDDEFKPKKHHVFKEFCIGGYPRGLEEGYYYYWKTWYNYIFWTKPFFKIDSEVLDKYPRATYFDPVFNNLLTFRTMYVDKVDEEGDIKEVSIYYLRIYTRQWDGSMINTRDFVKDDDLSRDKYLEIYCEEMGIDYSKIQKLKVQEVNIL